MQKLEIKWLSFPYKRLPMQIFLLSVTVILAIVLYRMLSTQRATYPFIRTTRIDRTDNHTEYLTTEAEQGMITIDNDTVIIEGNEYTMRPQKGKEIEAYLNVENGKLISIGIKTLQGEKIYFIDPEHSVFFRYKRSVADSHSHQMLSF